jgi:hypothetical protein
VVTNLERTNFLNNEASAADNSGKKNASAMRNLIIDGAKGGEIKRRHDVTFPLLTLHRGKDCVHFSTGFFQKRKHCLYRCPADFSYEKPMTTLLLMHDRVSFDKIQPKQVGYFRT